MKLKGESYHISRILGTRQSFEPQYHPHVKMKQVSIQSESDRIETQLHFWSVMEGQATWLRLGAASCGMGRGINKIGRGITRHGRGIIKIGRGITRHGRGIHTPFGLL